MTATNRAATSGHVSADVTGITVKTSVLAVLVSFPGHPCVGIDDDADDQMLGREEFFPVEPGWHQIRCFIRPRNLPDFSFLRIGNSSIKVLVPRGCIVSLRWSVAGGLRVSR